MSQASDAESESLYAKGMELYNNKNYSEAESYFQRSFDAADKSSSKDGKRQQALKVLFAFVFLYRAKGDSAGEETVLKKGVELARSLGDSSEELMYSWNLCKLLGKAGRFTEAQPILERRLELSKRCYTSENSNLIEPMREVAANHAALKDYESAQVMFEKTLELAKRCNAPPGQIAQIQDELAQVLALRGNTVRARELRKENTNLRERGTHYQIVIAKRQIQKGELLSADLLAEKEYFLPEGAEGCPPFGYIKSRESAFGKHARQAIGKGSTITSSMFE